MLCRKTVTEKKLTANRLNAQHSTGARTPRGKSISRFNAVITGLFAEHVVVPVCDGDDSEFQFGRLVSDLQREYQPEGPSEAIYVTTMAQALWKHRRASRCEAAMLTNVNWWEGQRPKASPQREAYCTGVDLLESAQKEIIATGGLSPASYDAVLPAIELAKRRAPPDWLPVQENDGRGEAKTDVHFLASLFEVAKQILEIGRDADASATKARNDDYFAARGLTWKVDTEAIQKYWRNNQKQFDWALQHLLASQQRRKNSQTPA